LFSGAEAGGHVASVSAGPTCDAWSPENLQLHRRLPHPHAPLPRVPHKVRLQLSVRRLQNPRHRAPRRGPEAGPGPRRGLPQRGLHRGLQRLRRAQEPVPGAPEMGGPRGREAPRGARARGSARGERRRRSHAERAGEDAAGEIRCVRDAADRTGGAVPVRAREGGLGGA